MTKWYFMQMLKNLSGKRKWLKCTTVYCEVCCDLFHLLLLPRLQAVHSYSQYSNIHCIFLVSVEVLKMHIPPHVWSVTIKYVVVSSILLQTVIGMKIAGE
jgi:hypothetical protein